MPKSDPLAGLRLRSQLAADAVEWLCVRSSDASPVYFDTRFTHRVLGALRERLGGRMRSSVVAIADSASAGRDRRLSTALLDAESCVIVSKGKLSPSLSQTLASEGFSVDFAGFAGEDQVSVALRRVEQSSVSVCAFVTTFNEADIIEHTLQTLRVNGVSTYVIDNWSTDGTWEILEKLYAKGSIDALEQYPADGPTGTFDLAELLKRVEVVSAASDYDWCIHHDADEVRKGPWLGLSLSDSVARVDAMGYNAIDFTCIDFKPVDDGYDPDRSSFEEYFRHFEFGRRGGHFRQIKGWKNARVKPDLATNAGHEVVFKGRRVFPYKFLLKHYPIRSNEHGRRKILDERQTRWNLEERTGGWHTHYDKFTEESAFVHDAATLTEYISDEWFYRAYLIERLTGIGIERES